MTGPHSDHLLLGIANQVAYDFCIATQWSTWHFWDYYRRLGGLYTTDYTVDFQAERIWSVPAPYGSCVDIAIQITKALRSSLAKSPGLDHYASKVQTLARASSTDWRRLTHCLTALFLEDSCIVIDLSFTFGAVKIDLNCDIESLPAIGLDGKEIQCRLIYSSYREDTRKPSLGGILSWERLPRRGPVRHFRALEDHEAIREIGIPMAKDTEVADGLKVPRSKAIKIQKAFDNKPICLPSACLLGKYFATVCRVKVNFGQRKVTVQIPHKDWLLREEYRCVFEELESKSFFQPVNDTVSNLVLDLNNSRHNDLIREEFEAVSGVVESLGMSRKDFENVVMSVYESHWV